MKLIKCIKPRDFAWFIYLSLMMSFVFMGAQQKYTFLLLVFAMLHVIFSKRIRLTLNQYKGCIWYGLFATYVICSMKWSVYKYNYTGITGWVVYIFLSLTVLNYSYKQSESLRFFEIFTYSGVVFSVVALVSSPLSTYGYDSFSGITGQYRTWIGEISALLFGINLCLSRYYKYGKRHIVFSIMNIATVIASGARGPLLLLIIIGLLYIFKEKYVNKKIIYIICALITAAIIGLLIINNEGLYYAFVSRLLGAIRNDGSTISVTERIYFMKVSWELFKNNPIVGCGVDAVRGYLSARNYWHVTYSHCQYLELLASYGVVGTIVFMFPALFTLIKRRNEPIVFFVLIPMLIGYIWGVEYYSFIFIILMDRLQAFSYDISLNKSLIYDKTNRFIRFGKKTML